MIEVRRAADRFVTRTEWLESYHCFSFGPHYDPTNTSHGLLLVSNDDIVAPHTGFGTHEHRDTEIVTWVLEGVLHHADSTGQEGEIRPGQVQRMSAGSGVLHSERNPGDEPVHFVQMWVRPETLGLRPSYEQAEVDVDAERATVASGIPDLDAAVRIGQRAAALHVMRPRPGRMADLPVARHVHVYVARGSGQLEGVGSVEAGDAVRVTGEHRLRLSGSAEALVWEFR